MNSKSEPGRYSLRSDYFLWALVLGLLVLTLMNPAKLRLYPQLVHWPTIQAMLGLLILTSGFESSGWLSRVAGRIALHIHQERLLALFLVAASMLLAMVLTNDVALFVVIPLTLSLDRILLLPVRRLIVFEALGVNCGAMLTPIGNPQNIFLWQHSGMHFTVFMWKMLPLFAISAVLLALFVCLAFRSLPVSRHAAQPEAHLDRRVFLIAAVMYLPFLILSDLHYTALALGIVTVTFLLFAPRLLYRIDWPLIVVFILMFVDMRLLAQHSWIRETVTRLQLHQPEKLYVTGALLSQAVSNVPAAILLADYSTDWRTLAWAVDVGGFGLVIGSLANLIALRIGRQRGTWLEFHLWSVPFFLLAGMLGLLCLWLI